MYSKDELRRLKTEFWTTFGQFSQLKRSRLGYDKKWILYRTKLKGLELKFDFLGNNCIVAIEIDTNYSKSEDYISRINLLKDELIPPSTAKLNSEYLQLQHTNKQVYRIFFEKTELTFKNKNAWPDIFEFFFNHMIVIEQFIIENKDILEQ